MLSLFEIGPIGYPAADTIPTGRNHSVAFRAEIPWLGVGAVFNRDNNEIICSNRQQTTCN